MSRLARSAAVAAVVFLAACSSTQVISTWRAPDSGPYDLKGKKVAALVMTKNEGRRRSAEAIIVKHITKQGATGIPSWTLIPHRDVRDEARAREAMKNAGIDAVVSMSVVDREKEVSYTPGYWTRYPRYRSFWGGWYGYGWGAVYEPPRAYANRIVSVETLVYSLNEDRLIWASTTKTVNPDNAEDLFESVADRVADELKGSGLLR